MNLNVMKFKNYVWPHNPFSIDISVKRNLKEAIIPFKGSLIQDFGREKRIVSGAGQFFGSDCLTQFESLFDIFKQGGSGYLAIPGISPFLAIFKELQLVGDYLPNFVNYTFEFWEDLSLNVITSNVENTFYTVLQGDSLWNISAKFNISIENLLALNSNIKNLNMLSVGQKVRLQWHT